MIAEQWRTALSPAVRLRENRDVDHGGTVALIAVSNGGQSGRMRFYTHTPAFLFVSLSLDSIPHRLSRRMIQEPSRAKLLWPVFYHTVAVRDRSSIPARPGGPRPPLQGLSSHSFPERFPIPRPVSAIQTAAQSHVQTSLTRRAGGRPSVLRLARVSPKDELRPASSLKYSFT